MIGSIGIILYTVIFLALLGVIVFQEILHAKERKDLYSRLMAKDLTEYNVGTFSTTPPRQGNTIKANLKRYYEESGD